MFQPNMKITKAGFEGFHTAAAAERVDSLQQKAKWNVDNMVSLHIKWNKVE